MSEELGDDNQVVALADEPGAEGVPPGVCGDGVVITAAVSSEAADDAAGTADRQSIAAAVEQQRRRAVGARLSGAFVEPELRHHKPSAADHPHL